MPADDSREISCRINFVIFEKKKKNGKVFNCRLLQIIGGALRVQSPDYPPYHRSMRILDTFY